MNELEQLGERIAEQAAHLDAAMHRLLADLREFDERGGWHAQGAQSCAHWLAWRVGWDQVTARERVRVARKLAGFSAIDDALRRGEISYSKVRAMLRIATPANERLLLDHARLMTASQLEVLCRKYAVVQRDGQVPHPLEDAQRRYVRRRDTEDGMVKIEAVLHPEEAELVWTMLNHAASELVRERDPAAGDEAAESRGAARVRAGMREAPAPGVMIALPTSDADTRQLHGPTEAIASPSSREATAAASAEIHPAGDSAESPRPGPARAATAVASAEPGDLHPADDSAESPRHGSARAATAAASAEPGDLHPADDSAESPRPGPAREATAAASAQHVEIPADDSAESPCSETPARPLLDRLLDEAESLRDADIAPDVEAEISSSVASTDRGPSVLQQRAEDARRAFSRADALVSLAQGYLRGDRPDRAPIEVTLTIPASSLRSGAVDPIEVGELGESFVSGEAARRLSCDAGVVEVVEDEHGAPLSVGRKRRTIAGALRRALRKRDTTCTYPGCSNRIFLEGHHIKHWVDGGETSLRNTALLCSIHHRFVHEYGYAIELGPDQRPRFRDSHGRLVAEVPERPAVEGLGWPHIRTANAPLAITADTIACGWDGTPADYGAIVGHFVAADGGP